MGSFFSRSGLFAKAPHKAPSLVLTNEGPRGQSLRVAVYLRHLAYVLIILTCSAVTHYCFVAIGQYQLGGKMMFALIALVFVAGAAGTMFYTNQRNEILEQVRHYAFGYMALPGTVLALIMWGAQVMAGGGAETQSDQFLKAILIGLPMVWFCTVVIPPILFVKWLSGIRTLHRSRLDDAETMGLWTRQDHRQL